MKVIFFHFYVLVCVLLNDFIEFSGVKHQSDGVNNINQRTEVLPWYNHKWCLWPYKSHAP